MSDCEGYAMNEYAPKAFSIDWEEWTHILTSILAICLTLTFQNGGINVEAGPFVFFMTIFAITVGSSFLLHELSHKYVAVRLGAHARYQVWLSGLLLMLGLAIVPQILWHIRLPLFLAPGAVMIYSARRLDARSSGLISVAGPLMNLFLACVFFALATLFVGGPSLDTAVSPNAALNMVLVMGVQVNLVLAMFNLLPIFPLDGFKVMLWDWRIWLMLFAIAFFGVSLVGV